MTDIINDTVETTLTIDEQNWLIKEAIVERSRTETPDYVDMIIIPEPNSTAQNLPDKIDNLLGASFEVSVNNQLISERDTNAEETTLLFSGNLANISPTGENTYEAIAYDPSQQAFAKTEGDGGSIMNETVKIGAPTYTYTAMYNENDGLLYEPVTIKANELIEKITSSLNLTETDIELKEGGVTVTGKNGSYTGGYNKKLVFNRYRLTVKNALQKAKEATKSEWWFDREGVFHFGVPRPNRHNLRFITDTSAGKTTPPYQSVRVIGSGSASQEGYSRTSMNFEDKIVVEAELAIDENGDPAINKNPFGELPEPTFEYRNLEISNDEQAANALEKIGEELGEQQADGSITVAGFPEIEPLDGVVMPQSANQNADNYSSNQPMGGAGYNVYKVTHFLNSSDGFTTQIEVAGVTGVTKITVSNGESYRDSGYPETPDGVGLVQ